MANKKNNKNTIIIILVVVIGLFIIARGGIQPTQPIEEPMSITVETIQFNTCQELCESENFDSGYNLNVRCNAGEAEVKYGFPNEPPVLSCCCYNIVTEIDTDGDGIPDAVDNDDDNDGFSDQEEIDAGTNPLDENDYPESQPELGCSLTTMECGTECINRGGILAQCGETSCPSEFDNIGDYSCSQESPCSICCCKIPDYPQDSDGDGWFDDEELSEGTDPYDPNDYPNAPEKSCDEWVIETKGDSYDGFCGDTTCVDWQGTQGVHLGNLEADIWCGTKCCYYASACEIFALSQGFTKFAEQDWCESLAVSDCSGGYTIKNYPDMDCCMWECN